MITNGSITYYHKTLDNNKLPVWNRYVFESVWHFGGKGSSINKGYENANDVNIRVPMEYVNDKDIFTIELDSFEPSSNIAMSSNNAIVANSFVFI